MLVIAHSPRTIIREFAKEEEHLILKLFEDRQVTRYTGQRTMQEVKSIFQNMFVDYKLSSNIGRWAIINRSDGEFMGTCMIVEARPELPLMEIGFLLAKKYWGRGIATEVVKTLVDHGFYAAGLSELYAITYSEHKASQRVLNKCGFTLIDNLSYLNNQYKLYRIQRHSL